MKRNIDAFLKYLAAEKHCSENTIAAYHNDLNQLCTFVQARTSEKGGKPSWAGLNSEILLDYLRDLKDKRYAPATVARKVATAKSFVTCLVSMGKLRSNPTDNLVSPHVSKSVPMSLSVSEVRLLLSQPAKLATPEAKRDQAMLELLYATGMRVSQLVVLNLADFDWAQGSVRCYSRVAGERCIPVNTQVMTLVKAYVDNARPKMDRDEKEAAFLNQRGDRLTRQGFWLILKGYAEKAGLGPMVTPHTLRHSFAVHKLSSGADLHYVQQLLGHTHILSTKVYQQVRPHA